MKNPRSQWPFWLSILLLTVYSAFFFARPINLATADLGRHLVNGELLRAGVTDVLYHNHYSFTEPKHSFLNHHWGSGVLFSMVKELTGFSGLSILYILLNVAALAFMTIGASVGKNRALALLPVLSIVPMLAYRVEVRPEGFSYALFGLYFLLLRLFQHNRIGWKPLLIGLTVAQIVWINLHIFFFFGIALVVVFTLHSLINNDRKKAKELAVVAGVLTLASLMNPHHVHGLLAPLTIFNEYGYMVAENQNILFMHERFGNPELFHFEIFGVIAVVLILMVVVKRKWKEQFAETLLALGFLVLAAMAVRGIPLFALMFVPLATNVLEGALSSLKFKTRESLLRLLPYPILVFCLIFISLKGTYASALSPYTNIGLITGINRCGEFLRSQQIPGRMFNNYDFGSYLIYNLHDRQKVFVDNRPEAYSIAFFDSIYKPMQEDEAVWEAKSREFGINQIVFFRLDNTPWAQPFLIRRTQDPNWTAIYVDEVSIVLVRNVEMNRKWIEQFGLPRDLFRGVPN